MTRALESRRVGQQQEKTVADVAAPGLLLTDDELTKLYEGSKRDALPVGSEVRQMVGEIRWHRARANTPASNDFVLVPRVPTDAMLDAMHDRIRILVDPEARTADIQNDRELWSALLAAAPASPEPASNEAPGRGGVEAFGAAVFRLSWDALIDGQFDVDLERITKAAVEAGLLKVCPFDPEVHNDETGAAEAGDDFYQPTEAGCAILDQGADA